MTDRDYFEYRIDEPLSADDYIKSEYGPDEDALYDALADESEMCLGDCSDCTRADENGECDE